MESRREFDKNSQNSTFLAQGCVSRLSLFGLAVPRSLLDVQLPTQPFNSTHPSDRSNDHLQLHHIVGHPRRARVPPHHLYLSTHVPYRSDILHRHICNSIAVIHRFTTLFWTKQNPASTRSPHPSAKSIHRSLSQSDQHTVCASCLRKAQAQALSHTVVASLLGLQSELRSLPSHYQSHPHACIAVADPALLDPLTLFALAGLAAACHRPAV